MRINIRPFSEIAKAGVPHFGHGPFALSYGGYLPVCGFDGRSLRAPLTPIAPTTLPGSGCLRGTLTAFVVALSLARVGSKFGLTFTTIAVCALSVVDSRQRHHLAHPAETRR